MSPFSGTQVKVTLTGALSLAESTKVIIKSTCKLDRSMKKSAFDTMSEQHAQYSTCVYSVITISCIIDTSYHVMY